MLRSFWGGVYIYVFSCFETGCSQVVLVKSVVAIAVGEKNDTDFEMNIFASHIMNNFAFGSIVTLMLFHVQSRQNGNYGFFILLFCFVFVMVLLLC